MLKLTKTHLQFKRILNYFPKFNFAVGDKLPVLDGKANLSKEVSLTETKIQPWIDVENRLSKLRNDLVLSDQDKIEKYVFGVLKGYFRTTYKEGLTLESNLEDHGLDSLDAIELAMVLEDELGYIIEAETMPQFKKVKHFVNFIKQMEAYKQEFHTMPQEKAHSKEENWDEWIPKGEALRSKLFKYTDKDVKKQSKDKKDDNKKTIENKH